MYNLTILDTITGIEYKIETEFDGHWWSEGNGACDCNRNRFTVGEEVDEELSGKCIGCKRFLIVESDFINYTNLELNQDYPKELLQKYFT